MINEKYFEEINKKAIDILDNSNLEKKELLARKNHLSQTYNRMISQKEIDVQFIDLLHEIKSYDFLKKYDNLRIARDSKSETGADFRIDNKYHIECICCSSGDTNKSGLEKYRLSNNKKSIIIDYNKLLEILLPRITNALQEKSKKFKKYIQNDIIKKDDVCIIFISLGDIATDFFSGQYGMEILNVLIGKSHLTLKIDKNTNKYIESFYSHVEEIKKYNGQPINANFFLNEDNRHISGIIFTDAHICDLYDKENTYLFLNPYANNKVTVKDFNDLVYWKINNKNEYIPRFKGKNLWNKFKNEIY